MARARARGRESAWRTGPPKWTFTAYGVGLASLHLALAAADWGRAFDLWEAAWPFYASLVGITSAAAVVLHGRRGRYAAGGYDVPGAWYGGGDVYGPGEVYGGEGGSIGGDVGGVDYPRPSRG